MAETPITRVSSLQWPIDAQQIENLDATIDDIYELLRQRKAAAGGAHDILSSTHSDTTAASAVDGDLLVRVGGLWVRFPIGSAGEFLQVVAGAPDWSTVGSSLTALDASNITLGTLNAARLATSGVVAGTYGDSSNIPVVTVDNKGRVTVLTTIAVSVPPSTHNLLSSTHPDTTAASPSLGDLVVAQNSGALELSRYWFDGQPIDYIPNGNDNGTQKFWFDGQPGAGLSSTGAVTWARKANGTTGYVLTAGATGPDWQPSAAGGSGAAIYKAADFSLARDVATAVVLDTAVYDDGFWSATNPTRLTVPAGAGGTYQIVGAATMDSAFIGGFWLSIYVNGVEVARTRSAAGNDTAPYQGNSNIAAIERLAAGDYVELFVIWSYSAGAAYTIRGGRQKTSLRLARL